MTRRRIKPADTARPVRAAARRWRVPLMLSVGLLAHPAAACQMPQGLLTLARTMSAMSGQTGEIAEWQSNRLAADLASISETGVLKDMANSGLEGATGAAIALMTEAERIHQSGRVRRPGVVSDLLANLDGAGKQSCSDPDSSIFQSTQQESFGAVFTDGKVDWPAINRKLKEERALSFVALVGALFFMIFGLFLVDSLFRWIMALVYNRKACRIPSVLRVEDIDVPGLIVTLGKGGCRFHPDSQSEFDAVLPALRGAVSEIHVVGQEMPVRVSAIYDLQCDFKFGRPLTVKTQKAILTHSTISPYYIKKSRDGGAAQTEKIA